MLTVWSVQCTAVQGNTLSFWIYFMPLHRYLMNGILMNNNKILALELVFTTGAGWMGEHNLVGFKLPRLGSNTLYLVM